jgi:hypothetical protein
MTYDPVNWKNRVVERPRTYHIQNNPDGTVTLIPAPGQVYEEGTPVDALHLNKMEQGLVTHLADDARHLTPDMVDKININMIESRTSDLVPTSLTEGRLWQRSDLSTVKLRAILNGEVVYIPYSPQYLYKNGKENETFIAGYSTGTGTQSKASQYLSLQVTAASSIRTYATSRKIDLGKIATITVEWEASPTFSTYASSAEILVLANPSDLDAVAVWSATTSSEFAQRVRHTLDVENLDGMYNVGVRLRQSNNRSDTVNLKVHAIKVEPKGGIW